MPWAITRETAARVVLRSSSFFSFSSVIFQHVARKRKTSSSVALLPRKSLPAEARKDSPNDSLREVRNGILTLLFKDVAWVARRLFRRTNEDAPRKRNALVRYNLITLLSSLNCRSFSPVLFSCSIRNVKSWMLGNIGCAAKGIWRVKCICNPSALQPSKEGALRVGDTNGAP